MFEFRSISCPKSTSFWAWGTQSTLSSDGFCSVRGGLVFCFLCKPQSQPSLRAARRNSAESIIRLDLTRGGHQRLTGRPRLSSFHTLTFLTTYNNVYSSFYLEKCKRSRTPQCGGGECLPNVGFFCFDLFFSALIGSIVNITLAR